MLLKKTIKNIKSWKKETKIKKKQKKMAKTFAYPDLAFEKFTGSDPNEEARDF